MGSLRGQSRMPVFVSRLELSVPRTANYLKILNYPDAHHIVLFF